MFLPGQCVTWSASARRLLIGHGAGVQRGSVLELGDIASGTITTTRLSPVEDDRIADDSFLCAADCASVAAPDADRSFKLQFEMDSAEVMTRWWRHWRAIALVVLDAFEIDWRTPRD